LAYQPTPYVFAYRIDLLRDAGYDRPPHTWAELEEYARALTVTENGRIVQAGFAFPAAAGNFVEYDVFVFGNGGGFFNANGQPTLNTAPNLEALAFIGSLINDVSIDYNSNETNPFMTGNAAMTLIDNIRLTPMFAMEEYAGKVGIALPPANEGKRQMTFSGCRLLFIGKDCKNKDLAFEFIRYALSGEVVTKRSIELNVPPVLFSQAADFARLDPYNAVRSACVENGIGMPITTWSSLFQRVRNEMVQRVLHGEEPAAVMLNAQEKLEQEISDAR
jgi:ABC-type glycerol-3-phosphate transport system substrate-binding protein